MGRLLEVERNVRVCAVAGAVTIAFSSILVRLSHASPSTAAIFRCAYALPILGLLAWLEDRRFRGRTRAQRRTPVRARGVFAGGPNLLRHLIRRIRARASAVLANVPVVL